MNSNREAESARVEYFTVSNGVDEPLSKVVQSKPPERLKEFGEQLQRALFRLALKEGVKAAVEIVQDWLGSLFRWRLRLPEQEHRA